MPVPTDLPPRLEIVDAPGHWAACWLYAEGAPRASQAGPPPGRTNGRLMKYLLQRIAFYLFTAWAAMTINFFIPRLIPGDPVALINRFQMDTDAIKSLYVLFGLDENKSMWQQYLDYWAQLFRGDLGLSFTFFPTPVSRCWPTRCRGRSRWSASPRC